jgi:hypothetical protein
MLHFVYPDVNRLASSRGLACIGKVYLLAMCFYKLTSSERLYLYLLGNTRENDCTTSLGGTGRNRHQSQAQRTPIQESFAAEFDFIFAM